MVGLSDNRVNESDIRENLNADVRGERGVQTPIGVEPRDQTSLRSIDLGKVSCDQYFSISLNVDRQNSRRPLRSWIEVCIQSSIRVEAGDVSPRHAIDAPEAAAEHNFAI